MGPIGTLKSYCGNAGAGGTTVGAVSASEDPAALNTIPGAVGGAPKGVLLNDGKREKLYWLPPGTVNTGGPVKGSAIPSANSALP